MNQREAQKVLYHFQKEFEETYLKLIKAKERLEGLAQDTLCDVDGEFLEATAALKLSTDGDNPGQWIIKSVSEIIEGVAGQTAKLGVLVCVVDNIRRRGDK